MSESEKNNIGIQVLPSPHTNSIVELLKFIRTRPLMYIGDKKISSIHSFLDGFHYALYLNHIKGEDIIPFWYFHEFVSRHYNWGESTAGWCHIILEENSNDEERSLNVFFELFEQFANIKILSIQDIKLNDQHIAFHNSEECQRKRITDIQKWEKSPLYTNPTNVSLLELSNGWFIYYVVNEGKKDWEKTIFKDKETALKDIENLFGKIKSN